jgi:ribonuclease PH
MSDMNLIAGAKHLLVQVATVAGLQRFSRDQFESSLAVCFPFSP